MIKLPFEKLHEQLTEVPRRCSGAYWAKHPAEARPLLHFLAYLPWTVVIAALNLAHLDAAEPTTAAETISILRINRNAAVIIDSDRERADDTINATKQRVASEIVAAGGYAWITSGREIENYIPASVLMTTAALTEPPGAYTKVAQAIRDNPLSPTALADKVTLAQAITPRLTKEMLTMTSDLAAHLDTIVDLLQQWNRDATAHHGAEQGDVRTKLSP